MSDFLEFVFMFAFAADRSKPIERTWKGFVLMLGFSLLCMAAVYGVIAILFLRQYIQGIVAIVASIMITFLWYKMYRRQNKNG